MIVGCGRRVEAVVPFAVPGVACQAGLFQFPHLPVADLDALGVGGRIELGLDCQAGAGGGRADGVDDDFVAGQGTPAPVHRDEAEQLVLDPVPFRGLTWALMWQNWASRSACRLPS